VSVGERGHNDGIFSPVRLWTSTLSGFVLITVAHLLVDSYITILPPLMPLLSAKLDFSMKMAGIAVSIVSILSAWTQPFLGILLDRYNRGWMLPLSLLWVGVWLSMIGFAPNYTTLVLMACIGGLGSAVFHPLGSVVATASAGRRRGLLMSLYITAGNLGIALAPLVTIPLAMGSGGLPSLALLAIPAILGAAVFCFYRPGGTSFTRQRVGLSPAGRRDVPGRGDVGAVQGKGGMVYKLVVLNALMVIKGWVSRALVVYLPFYFTAKGYDYLFIAKLLSLFLFAGAIGGLIGGLVSDTIQRRQGIIIANLVSAVALAGFFATEGTTALFLLLAGNFFLEATYPATVVLGQELLPANAVMASGMMFGLSFGMGGVSAAVNGILAEIWTLESVLWTNVWLLFVAWALSYLLPGMPSHKATEARQTQV